MGNKMMLFKKIKDAYKFKQSSSFRGFKRIKLTTYGYKTITAGILKLAKNNPEYIKTDRDINTNGKQYKNSTIINKYIFDLTNSSILFFPKHKDGYEFIQVYCNGQHVGTIFKPNDNSDYRMDFYKAIKNKQVDAAHLEISGGSYEIIDRLNNEKYKITKQNDESFTVYLYIHKKQS